LIEIGRLENDVWTFTTQFQRYLVEGSSRGMTNIEMVYSLAFFRLLLLDASIIFRPVIVDPVNATLLTPL
jgi:hypothetical protein